MVYWRSYIDSCYSTMAVQKMQKERSKKKKVLTKREKMHQRVRRVHRAIERKKKARTEKKKKAANIRRKKAEAEDNEVVEMAEPYQGINNVTDT